MFEVPTVFVIGAGASAGWGFPVGGALRGEIAAQLAVDFSQDGYQIGNSTEVVDAFLNAAPRDRSKLSGLLSAMRARLYAYDSIDEFIDAQQHDDLTQLAKLAIAHVIGRQEANAERAHFRLEKSPETFAQRMSPTWLGAIATRMVSGIRVTTDAESIGKNVGFVIFNYDRSVEYFLHRWIAQLGVGASKAAEIVNSMQIYHPYGTIGDLPWQVGSSRFEFGRVHNIQEAAQSIRTFTEQIQDTADLFSMRLLVKNATRVVFLGFGFHKQNMELLVPKKLDENKHLYATAFEAPGGEQQRIRDAIAARFNLFGNVLLDPVAADVFAASYLRLIAS